MAAAAPEILPGRPGQNMANVLAAISRARADNASLLVLPAGIPEDMNRGALERQAGSMAIYPINRVSLPREELLHHHQMDVLCCSDSTPATISSRYDNQELAAAASHENMSVVVLACPMGGDGNRIYTGHCVIAQNGRVLQSADGYVMASVSIPSRDVKAPEPTATATEQSTTPWTPLPEMLPRVLYLQANALSHRMMACGATKLAVTAGRDATSQLALLACAAAVDRLKLSHKNIYVTTTGQRAEQIATHLGVTIGSGQGCMAVDSADLTARALEGVQPQAYAVNATVPRYVARLVLRYLANTCGDMGLSVPLRSIATGDSEPWEMYDFLLHFSLVYDLPKWGQARLLEDTFEAQYREEDIRQVLDQFFDNYHRPAPCEGPLVFPCDGRAPK